MAPTQRAARPAGASSAASSSRPSSPSTSGSRSTPSTRTARSQLRWLSPTCSRATRSGSTPNCAAIRRWRVIATLHSPIARWPSSSSAWVTTPTGLVKSTIHAPGAARRADELREVEHDRHGPERLGEAAGAGRLLADEPEAWGSVSSTSRAAWPPTRSWMSTKSAPSMAASRSVGQGQPTGPVLDVEHPLGEAADDRQPLACRCRAGRAHRSAAGRVGGRTRRPAPGCRCSRRRRPRP